MSVVPIENGLGMMHRPCEAGCETRSLSVLCTPVRHLFYIYIYFFFGGSFLVYVRHRKILMITSWIVFPFTLGSQFRIAVPSCKIPMALQANLIT